MYSNAAVVVLFISDLTIFSVIPELVRSDATLSSKGYCHIPLLFLLASFYLVKKRNKGKFLQVDGDYAGAGG